MNNPRKIDFSCSLTKVEKTCSRRLLIVVREETAASVRNVDVANRRNGERSFGLSLKNSIFCRPRSSFKPPHEQSERMADLAHVNSDTTLTFHYNSWSVTAKRIGSRNLRENVHFHALFAKFWKPSSTKCNYCSIAFFWLVRAMLQEWRKVNSYRKTTRHKGKKLPFFHLRGTVCFYQGPAEFLNRRTRLQLSNSRSKSSPHLQTSVGRFPET